MNNWEKLRNNFGYKEKCNLIIRNLKGNDIRTTITEDKIETLIDIWDLNNFVIKYKVYEYGWYEINFYKDETLYFTLTKIKDNNDGKD